MTKGRLKSAASQSFCHSVIRASFVIPILDFLIVTSTLCSRQAAEIFPKLQIMKTLVSSFPIVLAVLCFALLPKAIAVSPPPDGGYPGGNTAEGHLALGSLTTGLYNTGVGVYTRS